MNGPVQRNCVSCGQILPSMSKMSRVPLPAAEVAQNGWPGEQNPDGTVTVDLCMQCRIVRAERLKNR
jgi:hypothetical protein